MALPVLLRYLHIQNLVTLRIMAYDLKLEMPKDNDDLDRSQYEGYNELKFGDIPSKDTVESLEINDAIIASSGSQHCEFPRLRTLKLEKTLVIQDQYFATGKLLAPQLEHLIFIHSDWNWLGGALGLNADYLFGPLNLTHLSICGTYESMDITSYHKTQPNLLTLKMTNCTLRKAFLRSLSNVDGRSLETLPVLELIQISSCRWVRDYERSQFISDCAVGRPRTRVTVDL